MTKTYSTLEKIASNLAKLKKEFFQNYTGTSHIQEIIPVSWSETFPIENSYFESLHKFAQNNPIYYNSFDQDIFGINCTVYEGDVNKYWLNSIQHGASHAPFSPTWIFSAFVLSMMANKLGFHDVVDIGSGDGRIAYCAKILGCNSSSIEIDNSLVKLQNEIIKKTQIDFNPHCSDALMFDYSKLNLAKPSFFIGGLAQMGGNVLASGVLEKTNRQFSNSGFVFAGTVSPKYPSDPMSNAGWGTTIVQNNLKMLDCLVLPSMWTAKEKDDTHYIFTQIQNSNPN